MATSYQWGGVDARGGTTRAQAASPEAEHPAVVRQVPVAADGAAGSSRA